jgi:chaperonin GroES
MTETNEENTARRAPEDAAVTNAEAPLKIRPLGQWIMVRREKAEERSKGGIIIPDTAKRKGIDAEVIAVGPGRYSHENEHARIPNSVKPGDRVVLSSEYTGVALQVRGEDRIFLREDDLLGVREEA